MDFYDEQYLVTDHVGLKACFQDENFEKNDSFGNILGNNVALKDHQPLVFTTGETHRIYKERFFKYIEFALESLDEKEVIGKITKEFEQIKGWENLSKEESHSIDIEGLIVDIFAKVYSKIVFGTEVSKEVIEEWSFRSFKFCYDLRIFQYFSDKRIANRFFDELRKTPYFQNLDKILATDLTPDESEEVCKDLMFSLCFNGYGGTRNLLLSTLICLFRLSDDERKAMTEECESFMNRADRNFKDIEELKLLHLFYMEVARVYPPALTIYRRPKDNIVLESAFDLYEIPKGKLVAGKINVAQIDPLLYDNPTEISLKRDIKTLESNTYTWGGLYHTKSTPDNYKCPGAKLGIALQKIFIIHFLRCDMELSSDITYTGKNIFRSWASDVPLRLKTFQYSH